MSFSVGILGASGYTGAELIRLVVNHPQLKITALSADRKAGLALSEVFFARKYLLGWSNHIFFDQNIPAKKLVM